MKFLSHTELKILNGGKRFQSVFHPLLKIKHTPAKNGFLFGHFLKISQITQIEQIQLLEIGGGSSSP